VSNTMIIMNKTSWCKNEVHLEIFHPEQQVCQSSVIQEFQGKQRFISRVSEKYTLPVLVGCLQSAQDPVVCENCLPDFFILDIVVLPCMPLRASITPVNDRNVVCLTLFAIVSLSLL